ncbi:hypothetical protein MN116_001347 [Schistosoma mekongi]|uniref:EF-hand domain-containing protein n=1 Tax=Schistosoma mekongi TaxID=38744 RepID=A0AAE1ZLX9_SCHME|nr:hypothetical protein MN116_001347 [Schistosoma mekongi]
MLYVIICILCSFVQCDNEKLDTHFSGIHVSEFVHPEVHLEDRLHIYFKKIDTNNNRFIEYDELTSWIYKTYESLDREHAENQLVKYDTNKDAKVSLDEYISQTYETSEEELKHSKDDQSSNFILESLKNERSRFNFADKDGDGLLSLEEFTLFLRPENYEDMANYELQKTFSSFDQNGDGVITNDEFTNFSYRGVSQKNYLHEQFKNLDFDKNNLLTLEELRPWLLPSLKIAAKSEATWLMNLTDSNHDGQLTLDEILAKSHSWKDSQVVKHARSLWDEL